MDTDFEGNDVEIILSQSQLKIIIGLPGAGKSEYAKQMLATDHIIYDDEDLEYKLIYTSSTNKYSIGFSSRIKRDLRNGKNVAICGCWLGSMHSFEKLMKLLNIKDWKTTVAVFAFNPDVEQSKEK